MKNLFIISILVLSLTQSCKRGENDPFISLKSRDGRITGTWNLVNLEISEVDNGSTTTITYDGTTLTINEDGNVDSYLYSHEMTIEKDGTYERELYNDGDTYKNTGHWWWLHDKQKKTRIAFDDDGNSFYIDQLKNKELILQYQYEFNSTGGSGSSLETRYYLATYEKAK